MLQSSIVTVKGQIVIPIDIRQKIGIRKGTRVFFEEKNGDIIVHPATSALIDKTFGLFKGGDLLKVLETSRLKEKDREERKFGKK